MSFTEHTKRNWLITLFAAIFLAAITSMIFLNNPHQTVVIAMVFIAAALFFGLILGGWYLISGRKGRRK
ncbi:hypothetical protein [Corynebacterium confusum]|uniref:hypothetical protein n=1 Tax=Corynebacterium confusum TaxID=71254 RepID=UPI0025B4A007|nr:hypothetical protein [Corynebacterium confusum]WJY89069.1 hypothetical protein CCONF_02550 [Corynebacterium confusum]